MRPKRDTAASTRRSETAGAGWIVLYVACFLGVIGGVGIFSGIIGGGSGICGGGAKGGADVSALPTKEPKTTTAAVKMTTTTGETA